MDTSYGISCPFKGSVFRKLTNLQTNEAIEEAFDQPCKLMTQTQTLQIGCQNDQQYSLRTKLCYPNQFKFSSDKSANLINKLDSSAYTQLESEINLICLAHWSHDDNLVVISRSMSNDVLCSVSRHNFLMTLNNNNNNLKFRSGRHQMTKRL